MKAPKRSRRLPLSTALGEGLAAFRQDHNVRQEDIAISAREIGLKWTRATVANIEAGGRALSPEETLLLRQIIYGAAGQAPQSVTDLIADDVVVILAEGVAINPL